MTVTRGTLARAPLLALALAAVPAAAGAVQPSIVLLLTDDEAPSLALHMPAVQALAARGATFTHAYYNDPLCEPSRTTILTGRYAQNTGVETNDWADFAASGADQGSVAVALHAAGYRTALIGKYVNGYPASAGVPPGWDRWLATTGARYYGGRFEDQDRPRTLAATDYQADVLGAAAVDFVRRATADGVPFFLYLAVHPPHVAPQPPEREAGADAGLVVPRTPSFNEADVSDKPAYVRARTFMGPVAIAGADATYLAMDRTLLAVDGWLAAIEDALAAAGRLGDTYVVVGSDNGWMSGQHRIRSGKGLPYEESLRMPLYMAGPGVAPGTTVDALAGNADLAPTLAEWGGTAMPGAVDGRSLAPLLAGAPPASWRHAYPTVYRQGTDGTQPGWVGVRTDRYSYVEYATGERELYDMAADPYQLTNIAGTDGAALLVGQLDALAAALRVCADAACRAADQGLPPASPARRRRGA